MNLLIKLEKGKGGLIMNTFRNKQFKNELNPKYSFYDCLRSCELKSSSEKPLEECLESCEDKPLSEDSNIQK